MPDRKFLIGIKALVIDGEGRLLIVRKVPRKRTDRWAPFWDIPGGKIKDNGDGGGNDGIVATLAREVDEELGISDLKVNGLFGVVQANFDAHTDEGVFGLFFVVYRCALPEGATIRLSEEHDEYRWVAPEEAKGLLSYMLPQSFLEKL